MRRGFRLLTISTAVVVLGTFTLSACGFTTSTTQPSASASTTVTTAPKAVGLFCAVPIPESWKLAIASGLVTSDGTRSQVLALAPVGDKIVKAVLKGSVLHLEVGSPGGKQQFITNIANTYRGGYIGAIDYDGRWVVYSLSYELPSGEPWAIFAWDSQSAASPHKIAASPSNERFPIGAVAVVHQGKASWVSGSRTTNARQVHLYDLAARHDKVVQVVKTTNILHPFFAGNLLVWNEFDLSMSTPNSSIAMTAYDTLRGTLTNLPSALTAVRNSSSIAGDTKTWAWSDATFKQLWVWRTGWAAPKKIIDGGDVGVFSLSGDIVTGYGNSVYAADLRSGSYVKLTPENVQYGYSIAKGTHFAFDYGKTKFSSQYPSQVSFIMDVSKLPPLPACSPSK